MKQGWHQFTDKFFWALLIGVVSLGVSYLKDVSTSVNSLNIKIALVIEKVNSHEIRIDRFERP